MNRLPFWHFFLKIFFLVVTVLTAGALSAQAPAITSFTPTSGPVGTTVTITGTNFSATPADNIVWFGAVRAAVTTASETEVKVTVPIGATFQPITLTVNGYSAYSKIPFNIVYSSLRIIDETSLATKVDFTTGLDPQDVAIVDIDGDGKSDLIVTNANSNTISVYRNTSFSGSISSGSFAPKVNFDTYSTPYGISIGDIDCDGKPDLVVANNTSSSRVSVFRNTCTPGSINAGSFAARIDLTTGNSSNDVAISDIDGDGKPDLVITNFNSNTISIYRNISSPGSIAETSFDTRVDFPSEMNLQKITIADIDGDNKPDMIVPNYFANTVSVYKNISTPGSITSGSFSVKVDFASGQNPYCVATGDIDRDGKPDMVVTNYNDNTVSVFRNTSTSGSITPGSFDTRVDFISGHSPRVITIGDINGDSKPDLVVANFSANTISVLKNAGTPGSITASSFAAKVTFTTWTAPEIGTVGDLDGDGKPDIAVLNSNSNVISIFRNLMLPPLQPVITSFSPTSGPIGTTVTINGSNFSATPSDNIVWFGAVKATVTAATNTQLIVTVPAGASYHPVSVTVNELTAFSGLPFKVTFKAIRTIDGTAFSPKVDFISGTAPFSSGISDIDGDGKPDLIIANVNSNSISVFRNTSSSGSISAGSFDPKVDISTGSNPYNLAIGDIDGDGKPDLAVTIWNSNKVTVLRNTSTAGSVTASSFAAKVEFPAGTGPMGIVISDIDGDGRPDLVITNENNTVSILRNRSISGSITSGSFDNKVDFPVVTSSKNFVAVGDLDGDRKPDLVVTNYSTNTISVYRNICLQGSITSGSFAAKVDFASGEQPYKAAIGDLDGDSKPDLVVLNTNGPSFSVFRNTTAPAIFGTDSFASKVDFTTGTDPDDVCIGDINGDGKPDLAITNSSGLSVSIYSNNCIPGTIITSSFSNKTDFSTGSTGIDDYGISLGDIDGDAKPDLVLTSYQNNTVSVLRNNILEPVPPVITSFIPNSGPVGATVTINGTNFSPTTTNNIVWFGAVQAAVTVATSTQLTVTVPTGATYQPVSLTVNGLTAYSGAPFKVTFPSIQNIDIRAFPGKVDFNTGMGPKGIVISDIDGDGKSDMIVAQGGNSISVFRNTSTTGTVSVGSFSSGVEFLTLSGPDGVVASDIDGDGKQDIVVSNSMGNSVSVFRNISTPGSITTNSFDTRFDFTTNTGPIPFAFAINDIDGDGKPDLVVTNDVNSISVYRNTCTLGSFSTGLFAPKVDFSIMGGPRGVALGDIDGDGKPDLAVTSPSVGLVSVFKNTSISGTIGSASLATKVEFTAGAGPFSIAISDIDGDGKSDLVVTNSMNNTISIFRNISTSGSINSGSFAAKVDFNTNNYPQYCTIGDINGDGKPDIIIANSTNNSVSVFRNTSASGSITESSFAAKVDFPSGSSPRGVAIGDIDGDTKPDLLVTNSGSNSISIFRNAIPESIIPPPVITSFTPASGPVGTTVTITGTNFSPTPSNNIIWFGAVQAAVTAATATLLTVTVPAGATYQPITVTVNGLTAWSGKSFNLTFPGSGVIDATSFATKINFNGGTKPCGIAIGDIDGDGKPDLVVTNEGSNTVSIFRNISILGSITASSFSEKVDFITGAGPVSVAIADIDGDGKPDLSVANVSSNTVSVFRNISTYGSITSGSFSEKVDFSTGSAPYNIAIGDLDKDGKADLAVACWGSNMVSVLRNTCTSGILTTSSFAEKVDFGTGIHPYLIAIGDVDGDGNQDMAVTNEGSNTVSILKNTSTPGSIIGSSFAGKVDFATGVTPRGIVICEVDGDGNPDMIVTNDGSNFVSIFQNMNTPGSINSASFSTKIDLPTGNAPRGIGINDIDGNGKIDLVVTNYYNFSVSVFSNISTSGSITSGSFTSGVDFPVGSTPNKVAIADIDGDGKPDVVVPNFNNNTISVLQNKISEPVPPVITSFTPTSGQVGTTVTITGTNFSTTLANNIVKFGTLQAVVTAATSTQLTVILPAGATDNPISVTVNGLTGSSTTSFVVTAPSPPPVITSLSQTFGYIGMTLIINGTNFSTTPANNIVWFGAVKGNVTAATATQLQVTVPAGATYQPITVTVNGLTAYSKSPFIVTFPSLRTFDGATLAPKVDIPINQGWSNYTLIGDIDVDGKPDLIVTNDGGGSIAIYRNISNTGSITPGSFSARTILDVSGGASGIALGDIDGDGRPDIAAISESKNTVSVFRNMTNPGSITTESFGARIDFPTGSRPNGIEIGDIDGDGKSDLAVANYGDGVSQSSYTVSVFRNTGFTGSISSGSFAAKVDFQSSHGGVHVAFNDIDMDGKPDMIITTFTTNISIFRNTSNSGAITPGSFAPKVDIIASNGLNSSAVGDIDGDGKADLMFVNRENSSVSVLRNISTPGSITRNSFASRIEFTVGSMPYDVALGDIDGDSKTDLVIANNNSGAISLLKNTSTPGSITSGSFAPKVDFNAGNQPGSIAVGDIDGDGKPDIVVRNWYANYISILRNNMPTPNLPVINSINPNSGPVGSTITINGSNFSPVAGNNTIMFGTVQGTVTSATNNQLTVTVPAGANGQPVIIMVYGYWINSGIIFSVVAPDDIELESSILTLNGDGINERFKIKYFEIYGRCSFYVYNARGAVIFWNEDFRGEWDLTIKERMLETGGYFYVLKSELGTFKGSFSILKE